MGSPEFAKGVFKRLTKDYPVAAVFTQPDRPAGRGKVLTPPPVKAAALEAGIPVFQPERLRRPEAFAELEAFQPDLIVVAAYGQILRQQVLDLPRFGCLNVHASLLPRWRGAAPIQAAILHGDAETGVTIMKMDAGVDTGDMLAKKSLLIDPQDTSETLSARLSDLGADLLVETLEKYLAGMITPVAQPDEGAVYAPMLKKEDGLLDFNQNADALERKIRAYTPWPGAYFLYSGQPLKIKRASVALDDSLNAGETGIINQLPAVGTGKGALVLQEVQPAGKKMMSGKDFLRGARDWVSA